jgi:hypothetical protein
MDWALIISIIALVVATVALITWGQMIWGRPNLKVEVRGQHIYGLECLIQNVPITNKFIKNIGVRRDTVQDLSVFISIRDNSIGDSIEIQIYCDIGKRILLFDDIKSKHIHLPASKYVARANLIRAGKKRPETIIRAYIIDDDGQLGKELREGSYSLYVNVCADDKEIEITKKFRINNREPWVALEQDSDEHTV